MVIKINEGNEVVEIITYMYKKYNKKLRYNNEHKLLFDLLNELYDNLDNNKDNYWIELMLTNYEFSDDLSSQYLRFRKRFLIETIYNGDNNDNSSDKKRSDD